MMIPSFDYKIPNTIEEAIELLWEAGGKAKIIAGGTDLVIGLRNGVQKPQCLIDITKIPGIRGIDEKDGTVSIGAAATHSEISSSSLVKKFGGVLSDAASEIGSPQIRNLGTIGGNIINASPAADTIPALLVLDAVGRVVSKRGEKEVPLHELFKGPFETNLNPDDILTQVKFHKLPHGARSSFIRLARREAMAISRMSVAIVLQLEKKRNRIQEIRICGGSITPTPRRMAEAEATLRGKPPEEELIRMASRKISDAMVRWSGIRPSTSYKAPVVEALFVRALRNALEGSA